MQHKREAPVIAFTNRTAVQIDRRDRRLLSTDILVQAFKPTRGKVTHYVPQAETDAPFAKTPSW
jgi:hypothetical protein